LKGYTDRQQETQRESEGEVKEGGREAGVEEKHTVVHSLNQRYRMEREENKKFFVF